MGPYIGEEKSPIGMLSQVEQRTRLETIWVDALNPKVAGSNPVGPAYFTVQNHYARARYF